MELKKPDVKKVIVMVKSLGTKKSRSFTIWNTDDFSGLSDHIKRLLIDYPYKKKVNKRSKAK